VINIANLQAYSVVDFFNTIFENASKRVDHVYSEVILLRYNALIYHEKY
jgi:hypothetical protein